MKRQAIVGCLFILTSIFTSRAASAQTAVNVSARIGDFHVAVANYYHVPDREVVVIRERRISHVGLTELGEVAARRALAAAGMDAAELELIVFGTTSFDDQAPNQASGLQQRLGAHAAAAMDVNTACTSFLYAWSTANALIRTGVVRNALVLGGEVISRFMDWRNRNVAVLLSGCAAHGCFTHAHDCNARAIPRPTSPPAAATPSG